MSMLRLCFERKVKSVQYSIEKYNTPFVYIFFYQHIRHASDRYYFNNSVIYLAYLTK